MAIDSLNDLLIAPSKLYHFAAHSGSKAAGAAGSIYQYGSHFLRDNTSSSMCTPQDASNYALPGVNGEVPTKSHQNASVRPYSDAVVGSNYLLDIMLCNVSSPQADNHFILADLLWWNSGWSGDVTDEQTCSPGALTRPDSSGVGAEIGIWCHTALGSTSRNVTVKYANTVPTSGRTSTVTIPASWPAGRMIRVPLQYPDLGVSAIQSVQLDNSTGTVGNFGACIYRPIFETMPYSANRSARHFGPLENGMPVIPNDACITAFWGGTAAEYLCLMRVGDG